MVDTNDTQTTQEEQAPVKEEGSSLPEERLANTLQRMEAALSQSGNPDFKTFWEARKECLELFKVNISPSIKAIHWTTYRDLTKEAKRLKEIFEEKTAFAVEQIEIAITALENDINDIENQLDKIETPDIFNRLRALNHNRSTYIRIQKELNLLNAYAARVNALRKELIQTEMRIRQKNAFFQRLSKVGDLIFPKRKELIKEISQLFIDDINQAVKTHFSTFDTQKSLHPYREEIKSLQAVAKAMTLNTHAFTETRKKLSTCWDKIKEIEKQKKSEFLQQKTLYKENAEEIAEHIKGFADEISNEKISTTEAKKKLDELNQTIRSKELGREETKSLKDQLDQAYQPVKQRLINEEKKRRETELEKEQERQKKIKEIEERCSNFKVFENQWDEVKNIEQEVASLDLTDFEREGLLRKLIPIKDEIYEKEELKIISLPNDNPEKHSLVQNMIERGYARRNEVKEEMEKYRKASGASGLDFEQSMYFNEQLNTEKARLEKMNSLVAKLESTMAELKKNN